MRHLGHLILFATILALFFSFLSGGRRPNWKVGLIIWSSFVLGAIVLSLIMAPFA